MRSNLSNTLSFLAGLAAGAGLEYLMDPEAGSKRRRHLQRASASAVGGLGAALSGVGQQISSGVSHLGESAGHLGSAATHRASSAGHSMGDWLGEVPSYFSEFGHAVGQRASGLLGGMHGMRGHHDDHDSNGHDGFGTGSIVSTAVAAIGIGALLMYAMDPEMGRTRRKFAGDKVRGQFNTLRETARGRAKDLGNRISGYAHEARSAIKTEGPVSDRTLEQRIRAELGHVTDQVGQIMVESINGNVTLRGSAADSAADQLIAAARSIAGVQSVDDQLTRT